MVTSGAPPLCVGLYAKWGQGKSFLISCLKKAIDETARENPQTHDLVQWFEPEYGSLPVAITDIDEQVKKEEDAKREAKEKEKEKEKSCFGYELDMFVVRLLMCLELVSFAAVKMLDGRNRGANRARGARWMLAHCSRLGR